MTRVFVDIAGTSKWAGLVRLAGRPCLGARCRSLISDRVCDCLARRSSPEGGWPTFGISPDLGYKWLRRWQPGDRDYSRRPKRMPKRSHASVEGASIQHRNSQDRQASGSKWKMYWRRTARLNLSLDWWANEPAGRAGAFTPDGAPALPRRLLHRSLPHDARTEGHPGQGRRAGTRQAAGQCQPGLQDDGI